MLAHLLCHALQVRVYSLSSYLESPGQQHWQLPIRVHRMPSKLSSLAWNPDQPGVVTGAACWSRWWDLVVVTLPDDS